MVACLTRTSRIDGTCENGRVHINPSSAKLGQKFFNDLDNVGLKLIMKTYLTKINFLEVNKIVIASIV